MIKTHSHLHSHCLTLSQDCKEVDQRECLFPLLPPELSAADDDEQQKMIPLGWAQQAQGLQYFTASFITGLQSCTEGPLINTMSRASIISFYNEFPHLVFTSFIALAPLSGQAVSKAFSAI